MAPSMRLKATRRPPASQTAALTLMFISCAFVMAAWMMRLASASVRAIECPSLFCGCAAVDDELTASHERRFVGCQKDDPVGHVFGRADPAHRQPAHARLPLGLGLAHGPVHVR